ncbi:MAG: cbcM, partial [Deltaproteobacteria bacterium]|nr:cbcM [Deltaproteobacteria bacterium]
MKSMKKPPRGPADVLPGHAPPSRPALLTLLLALALLGNSCRPAAERSTCESCHKGIETASASHGSCVSCHGGDPKAEAKEASHKSMLGGKNPSAPSAWEKGCGDCHRYQLERVKSGLMYTNAGMIRNIQLTWEGEDGKTYAAWDVGTHDETGAPLRLSGVAGLENMSGELYRKFCSLCHLGLESAGSYAAGHASGCAACHFPFNDAGSYEGGDPTVRGKRHYSATHALVPLPDNKVCARCHNRSGRIALSYEGLNDGNNALVPTRGGGPGPAMINDDRNLTHIAPDVHFEKGMDCIDCHTSRDI